MEQKSLIIPILGIVVLMICIGCSILYAITHLNPSIYEREPRCSTPVEDFSEEDLVGTWVAGRPDQMDTLIIRADRTYKQIIHVEFPERSPIDYESDWQSLHLEYSENNIPYLHLTGMSFCGMNPAIPCEKRDGGGYDFCTDEYLQMNGEGILVVLGIPDIRKVPSIAVRQRYIDLFYPLGSENSWVYSYQEP